MSTDAHDLYQSRWITDKAYISGLSGIVMLLLLACLFHQYQVFEMGISLFGFSIQGCSTTTGIALISICLTMALVELIRLWYYDKSQFVCYSPLWIKKNYSALLFLAGKKYLSNLALLVLAYFYYTSINEYGFRDQARYYQPWFQLFEILALLYVSAGFFYHLLTESFKHDSRADMADLLVKILRYVFAIGYHRGESVAFSLLDKKMH